MSTDRGVRGIAESVYTGLSTPGSGYGDTVARANQAAQSIEAALPNLMKAIRDYDDGAPGTIQVIGLGSSVGNGATLSNPSADAPSPYLSTLLDAALNRLGNMTWAHTNGSVNGSTVATGASGDYAAAKVTAGVTPKIVPLAYGMNDGMPSQYHSGQTFSGMYRGTGIGSTSTLRTLIEQIIGDGADPVIMTTPHPHSTRFPWTSVPSPINYPTGGVQIPAATYAASVIEGDWAGVGVSVPASYRHLRINQSFRTAARDYGLPIIDAERYWFKAIAKYGEDALFNTGEYAHPNDLGHSVSYHLAIRDFVEGLFRPTVSAFPRPLFPTILARLSANITRTSTTMSDDSNLSFYAGANTKWIIEATIYYTTPTAADMKVGITLPSGDGRLGLIAPATDSADYISSPATFRSGAVSTSNPAVGGNTSDAVVHVHAYVEIGATGGNVSMKFAQNTASGTTTIYQYSWLRATKVG